MLLLMGVLRLSARTTIEYMSDQQDQVPRSLASLEQLTVIQH